MDMGTAMDMGREALWMVLIISAPMMVIGLIVGLLVALFQAVTQLQEQTLHFVPKIVAMAIGAAVFVPWITAELIEYSRNLFAPPF